MVQYLDELRGVGEPPLSPEELVELEQLRAKYEKLKQRSATTGKPQGAQAQSSKK